MFAFTYRNENDWSNYRKVRNTCGGLFSTAKDEYLDKQAAILDPHPLLLKTGGSYSNTYHEFRQQIQFTCR